MAEVEVTITVNDEGLVQSVRAGGEEFARLEEEVEAAASAGDDFASSQSQMADAARQGGDSAAGAAAQMSAYEKAVQALNNRGIQTTDQLREMRDELIQHQQQFPKNSRAARGFQAEIDRLNQKIGQKSVQEIQRQIQELQRLERQLVTLSGVMRETGSAPPISQDAVQGLEAAENNLDGFQASAVDATDAIGKVRTQIEDLNDALRETQTPDTQITAYEQAVRDLNNAGVVTTDQLEEMRNELEILQDIFRETDEGAAARLQTQIDRLNREIEMNGQESEEAAQGADEYSSAQERLNDVGIRTSDQIEEQIQNLEQLQAEYVDSARESQLLEDKILRLREELSRSGGQMQQMGRQTAKSRQFIFSAGDAVQDLRFGVAGAGNNIAFMAEQLAEMNSTATSAGSIMNSLSTAILGPAGLILGLQAVIGLGPVVAEKIAEMRGSANDLEISVEDATESFEEMFDILGQSERQFSVTQTVAEELSDELSTLPESVPRGFATDLENAVFQAGESLNKFESRIENIRRSLRTEGGGINFFATENNEEILEALEEIGVSTEILTEKGELTEEQFQQLQREFQENGTALKNFTSINEGASDALDDLVSSSQKASLEQRRLNDAIEEGLTAQELYNSAQKQLTEQSGELRDKLKLGLIDQEEALERQAGLIEEVLNLASGTELADTQPIEDLRQQWEDLNTTLEETEDSTEDSTNQITQAIADFIELQEQLGFEESLGIGTEASRAEEKVDFLRQRIEELGPEVDQTSEGFQFLVDKFEQFSEEAEKLNADSLSLDEIRQEFEDLAISLRKQVGITKTPIEATEEQVRFLEKALNDISETDISMDSKGVQELRNTLNTLRGVVTAYEGDVEKVSSTQEMFAENFEQTFMSGSDAAQRFQNHVAGMGDEVQQLSGSNQVLAAFAEEIDVVRQVMESGSFEDAEFFIEDLRQSLQELKAEADGATPAIDNLLSELDRMENRLKTLTPEVDSFGEAFDNIGNQMKKIGTETLITGFTELGRAIGNGAGALEAFGQAGKAMLADLAKMIGKMLIRMGAATIIAGDIGRGAALAAAGSALLALSGSLSDGGGGGTRTSAGSSQSGAVEAETQQTSAEQRLDVPGRRVGGPVQAGRPYKVGEGETEMFVPSLDGSVIPKSAFSGGRRSRRQTVQVNSQMNGQVEMGSRMRDLGFQLRDLIQEAEASISEST